MENNIQEYTVIPDGERVRDSERDRFVTGVMRGQVTERGYRQLVACLGGWGYKDDDFSNHPVSILKYETMPNLRWPGQINPCFQKLVFRNQDNTLGDMVVRMWDVTQNPSIAGQDGLLIDKGILVKKKASL